MKVHATAAVALLVLSAALPAAAQSSDHRTRTWSSHGGHDFNGQADRPGDYRCDAYWDRGRDDCGAGWRDQRPFVRQYSARGHRGHGSGGQGYRAHDQGTPYHGAYGRPDLVFSGSGYGGPPSGTWRDHNRSAWCAARFRSYDPVSGYYRAWSGRLVFCG